MVAFTGTFRRAVRDSFQKRQAIEGAILRGYTRAQTRAFIQDTFGTGFSNGLFADIRRDIDTSRLLGQELLRSNRPRYQRINRNRLPVIESPTRKQGISYTANIKTINQSTGLARDIKLQITDTTGQMPTFNRFSELLNEVLERMEEKGSTQISPEVNELRIEQITT